MTQPDMGDVSDGYHTFNELYHYRMLYHAAFVNTVERFDPWRSTHVVTVKSWRHSDGEECFGGGWFIVTTQLPTGQISNHYPAEHWTSFHVPEVDTAPEWDGHTPAQAAERLRKWIGNS